MNERIKQLAEQANIRFGRMAILDGDPRGMARFVTYSEFEKFAELIVKECMSISSEAMTNDNWPPHMIAKHFGVEE